MRALRALTNATAAAGPPPVTAPGLPPMLATPRAIGGAPGLVFCQDPARASKAPSQIGQTAVKS